jgi:hypothetical protein
VGFAQAPVVMANEAHNGLRRCVRTRQVGARMVRAAHEAGVRRLAMEALPWQPGGTPGPIRDMPDVPPGQQGYLGQPDMRTLMATALDLGWTLWAYDAVIAVPADHDPAEFLTLEFTNWREREQAQNLCQVLAAAPGEPLLVWSGNSHAATEADLDGYVVAFLDEHAKGVVPGPPPAPVRIFVMGANEWRDEQAWPPAGAPSTVFHLTSGGLANSRFGDGRLASAPVTVEEPPDEWVHDPARPVPFVTDQSSAQIGGPDDYHGVERAQPAATTGGTGRRVTVG